MRVPKKVINAIGWRMRSVRRLVEPIIGPFTKPRHPTIAIRDQNVVSLQIIKVDDRGREICCQCEHHQQQQREEQKLAQRILLPLSWREAKQVGIVQCSCHTVQLNYQIRVRLSTTARPRTCQIVQTFALSMENYFHLPQAWLESACARLSRAFADIQPGAAQQVLDRVLG